MNKLKNILIRIGVAIVVPAVVYVVFKIGAPNRFGSLSSMYILIQQTITPTVIGYAMAFGEIAHIQDFSIGARILLGGLVGGVLGVEYGVFWMFAGAIVASILCAFLTGILFKYARIPSMILSFGIVMIVEVLGAYVAGSHAIIRLTDNLAIIGRAPYSFIVFLVSFGLFSILYYKTRFSYNVRAIGSDAQVAQNMGINITNVKVWTYIIGGLLLGIASVLQLCYAGTMGSSVGMSSLSIVFRPMMSVMVALVLEQYVILPIGIFIGALSINMIFAGIIALGWVDALQNVALGFFMLVVMGISANKTKIYERISHLFKKKQVA